MIDATSISESDTDPGSGFEEWIDPASVRAALKPVWEPDFDRSIVDLEYTHDIEIDGSSTRIRLHLLMV